MIRRLALAAAGLLAACDRAPNAVAGDPDIIAATVRAAVGDTDAALREASEAQAPRPVPPPAEQSGDRAA